jgi:MPBQ/MSBQ methyltransferase
MGVLGLGLTAALALWLRSARQFRGTQSVAEAYDRWTKDALLERLWGDHVHLGYYGAPPRRRDFRQAKCDLVHELVRWSGLDQLAPGSTVLDVGCGIGGSARILAREYGWDVLAISISPAQIERARALTSSALASSCRFAVMDALDLALPERSFDAVWKPPPICQTSSATLMNSCEC